MRPDNGDRKTLGRSRIVVGACLLGSLLAGCTEEEQPSTDFIERADAICSEADEQIAALDRPRDLTKAQPFLRKVDDITSSALDRLDGIEPPASQAESFQSMVDLLRIALFYQPQLREAVKQQNVAAAEDVRLKISNAVQDASEIARTLGLQVCIPGGADPEI
jgi:hypothetical protein